MTTAPFRVLIAVDGSPAAMAAIDTARRFPWPESAHPLAVAVRGGGLLPPSPTQHAWAWSQDLAQRIVEHACRRLGSRWEHPDAIVQAGDPETAIPAAARKWHARTIVMGWRGHGRFRRLLAGSVSRTVLRDATVPVLVVRAAPRQVRHLLLGLDGSRAAASAVRYLRACQPPVGGRVTIMGVITPVNPPRSGLLAANLAARIRADITSHNQREREAATARLARAAESLTRAGWRVRTVLRTGAPLAELLDAVRELRADVLVVGAGGPRTLQLGRVGALAQAAVNTCPVPVFVVR